MFIQEFDKYLMSFIDWLFPTFNTHVDLFWKWLNLWF